MTPSHTTLPAHVGTPVLPAFDGKHVPLLVDVPACSVAAHASHAPAHAVLQQYPSTQLPLAHWFDAMHAAACASFATHALPLQ